MNDPKLTPIEEKVRWSNLMISKSLDLKVSIAIQKRFFSSKGDLTEKALINYFKAHPECYQEFTQEF